MILQVAFLASALPGLRWVVLQDPDDPRILQATSYSSIECPSHTNGHPRQIHGMSRPSSISDCAGIRIRVRPSLRFHSADIRIYRDARTRHCKSGQTPRPQERPEYSSTMDSAPLTPAYKST